MAPIRVIGMYVWVVGITSFRILQGLYLDHRILILVIKVECRLIYWSDTLHSFCLHGPNAVQPPSSSYQQDKFRSAFVIYQKPAYCSSGLFLISFNISKIDMNT